MNNFNEDDVFVGDAGSQDLPENSLSIRASKIVQLHSGRSHHASLSHCDARQVDLELLEAQSGRGGYEL